MFGIFKKKNYLVDLLGDFHDVHSHLLWGVDDGCADQTATDHLADRLADLGFTHVYLTPHVIYGLYDNQDEKSLRTRFAQMAPHSKVEYRLGAEYFLDENFINHVNSDQPLLTMGDNWVLTEYGLGASHVMQLDALFEVQMSGHNIIIAHPERYAFMSEGHNHHELEKLTNRKCALQLNLLSLIGSHGDKVRKVAEELLLEGKYTFVGSDSHSPRYPDAFKEATIGTKMVEPLKRLIENNKKILWK